MKKVITIVLIAAIAATSAITLTACGSAGKTAPTTAASTQAATSTQSAASTQAVVSAVDNAQAQDNDSAASQSGEDAYSYDDAAAADTEWRSEEGNAMSKDVATQTLMAYSKEEYPASTATSRGCMSFYDEDKGMYGYRVVLDIATAEGDTVVQGFLIYDDGSIVVE